MNALLTVLAVAAGLALFAVRPPTVQDCTPAQLAACVRRAGWPRLLLAAARITVVLTLLLLVEAARLTWHAAAAIGAVLAVIACGIEALAGRAPLEGAVR
ncbi:hypothetical protein [Spongiactinospora sp. TRM90649]|uniref:hypothetical protein n=1 Tax=Spongiactinospora sp. TRM90649 TaxID=3031114 RepID=UPI0023F7C26D|nr:hypothetical protein [Spongiactinospora sp. TRM90649]MDF5759401.1 hypothetical protein [Spongiactinospora sp. TRM90649]